MRPRQKCRGKRIAQIRFGHSLICFNEAAAEMPRKTRFNEAAAEMPRWK